MTAGSFNVSMLLTANAQQARGEIKGVSGDLQTLGQAAKVSGAATAAGMKQAETQIRQFRRAAEGASTNVLAQFNDIGVMMASGQSPFLLAAQQGTQISQALGPLGARGAVQALGGAFLGMLNPVNFAVFAAVAGLGLLGNVLGELFGDAQSFEDKMAEVVAITDGLEKSTKAYRDAAAASRVSIADLKAEYSDLADEIARARDQQERMTLAQASHDQNRAVDDLAGRAGGKALSIIGPADIAALDELIQKVDLAQIKISQFRGDDRAVFYQLNAIKELADQYGITAEQALRVVEASSLLENTSGTIEQAKAAGDLAAELEKSFGSTEAVNSALPGVLAGLQAIVEAAGGVAANMGASADEAARLASNFAAAQQRIAASGKVYSGRGGDPRTSNSQGYGEFVYSGPRLDANNNPIPERSRSGGRSSARQVDGAERLLTTLKREYDLLREIDPIQKEMIRNREALAGASAKTRTEVEQLIGANIRLEKQQKQAQDAMEFAGNAAYDALDALIIQGEKASDVMASLAASIAKALLQSALLGSGPLTGLFGGQGTGLFGKIGEVFGVPAKADGGWISGPGGPRDDKVLSWLSNGEFVVNAASAARHRPLLEQINSAPRFATGGSVGGAAFSPVGAAGGREPIEILLTLSSDLDARINRAAEDVSVRVVKGGIEHYDTKVLPGRMSQIQSDPRRVG